MLHETTRKIQWKVKTWFNPCFIFDEFLLFVCGSIFSVLSTLHWNRYTDLKIYCKDLCQLSPDVEPSVELG